MLVNQIAVISLASNFSDLARTVDYASFEVGPKSPVYFSNRILDKTEQRLASAKWSNVGFLDFGKALPEKIQASAKYFLVLPESATNYFSGWKGGLDFLEEHPECSSVGALNYENGGPDSKAFIELPSPNNAERTFVSLERISQPWFRWGSGAVQKVERIGGAQIVRSKDLQTHHLGNGVGAARAFMPPLGETRRTKVVYSGFIVASTSTETDETRCGKSVIMPPYVYEDWKESGISQISLVHQGNFYRIDSVQEVHLVPDSRIVAIDGTTRGHARENQTYYASSFNRRQLGPAFEEWNSTVPRTAELAGSSPATGLTSREIEVVGKLRKVWAILPYWIRALVERSLVRER